MGVKGKPIFIMTWPGTDPEIPSLLLNSHTDVVPVFPESWKYDAFEAVKEENGDIYARGTQDMKSVGIQHIEAIYRLKVLQKKTFKRTIHLCFIADEELGGHEGMAKYVVSKEFKDLNIGFAVDEGLASEDNAIPLFYGERNAFWVKFKCPGNPGHGSRFIENTAAEKVQYLINKWLEEAGSGIELEYNQKFTDQTLTSVAKEDPWYQAFMRGVNKHNLEIAPRIFPAGTDSRYIREVGIPAFGFSPMNNTPVLLHDHNEFLNEKIFLKGIDIFVDIIAEMASV